MGLAVFTKAVCTPEAIASLRLIRTSGIGVQTYYGLVDEYGSAQDALEALPKIAQARKKAITIFSKEQAEREIKTAHKIGAVILTQDHALYPETLRILPDAPPVLYALGNVDLLARSSVAMVGARNASLAGKKWTKSHAQKLGQAGYIIVSGLARGIDTAAHEASLETGTIAVLAGGVDNIYPPENKDLYKKIVKQGLVLSEMPMGTKPIAQHFPRRNRIVAGLAMGTIVVEATKKSGSLITTRIALEYGRDVFALPGSPSDPRAGGPNYLIKTQQAQLIETADDVIDALKSAMPQQVQSVKKQTNMHFDFGGDDSSVPPSADVIEEAMEVSLESYVRPDTDDMPLEQKILSLLSKTPIDIDSLVRHSNAPAADVLSALLTLELDGKIQKYPAGDISLV